MIEISTDTATICIFDPKCLEHRKGDIGDWWSVTKNELQEINAGNATFLNTGEDGTYFVNILTEEFTGGFDYNVLVRSGRLFIGPGEEVSGGGFEPDGSWGGAFIDLPPGYYVCRLKRVANIVDLFLFTGGSGRNNLTDLIRI